MLGPVRPLTGDERARFNIELPVENAPAYDGTLAYAASQTVIYENVLFWSRQAVPAGNSPVVTGGVAETDTYWTPLSRSGWSPVIATVEVSASRAVHKVTDWAGGQDPKPDSGKYLGPNGFVDTAAEAVNVRGDLTAEAQDLADAAAASATAAAASAATAEDAATTATDVVATFQEAYTLEIGLPSTSTPVAGSVFSASNYFMWNTPIPIPFTITGGHCYSSAGTMTIYVYDVVEYSDGTRTVSIVDSATKVVTLGVNSLSGMSKTLSGNAGQYVGLKGSASGVVRYIAANEYSGGHLNVTTAPPTALYGSISDSQIQAGLYLSGTNQIVSKEAVTELQAVDAAPPFLYRQDRLSWLAVKWMQRLLDIASGSSNTIAMHLMWMASDSWIEYRYMTQEFADYLRAIVGNGGHGWISTNSKTSGNAFSFDGIESTWTGWDTYDANQGGAIPACGTGVDGIARSSNLTTSTAAYTGLNCDILDIYSYDGPTTAKWRFRVNGGAWTTVTGTNTGGKTKTRVQPGVKITTLDIDTTVNTGLGLVGILGFDGINTGSGIRISFAGNAGLASNDFYWFASQAPYYLTQMAPEAVASMLGTNDKSDYGCTAEDHKAAMRLLAKTVYGVNPSIGIVLAMPFDTIGTSTILVPLIEYAKARYAVAQEPAVRAAFWNWYDEGVTYTMLGTQNINSERRVRTDQLHPDKLEGRYRARQFVSNLLT